MAPEIMKGDKYDGKKSDIYSLGVIVYLMAYGSMHEIRKNQIKIYQGSD